MKESFVLQGIMEGAPGQALKPVCRMGRESLSRQRYQKRRNGESSRVARVLGTEGNRTPLGNMEVSEKLS